MLKIVDVEGFVVSEEISKCNGEILQKYFRFLRHEGTQNEQLLIIWKA